MFSILATYVAVCIVTATVCNAEKHDGSIGGRLMYDVSSCTVPAWTEGGWVCGIERVSYNGAPYASFRGVPYARPPVGELRFVAPQPVEPWAGYLDASTEGPVCVQSNYLYGPMLQPHSMSEDCLRVNVHVPAAALPASGEECSGDACLPVLFFVHGGGFQTGLGPFGFLSLNSSSVPGNTGLRDQIAALQWVQTNIRAFGGDPAQVTLMGQSAGASSAHILSLSEATQGLFTKVILMSGTASGGFFSTTQSYAQYVLNTFLEDLGINSTDAEEIHSQLIELPYETIREANDQLLDALGFCAFNPVVETEIEGVTRILDDDPDILIENGRGSSYPLMVGITSVECETLKVRLEEIDIVARIEADITNVLPIRLLFSASDAEQQAAAETVMERYFNGTVTMDEYIPACSDGLFVYPALKLAHTRVTTGGAPVYFYRFWYSSDFAPVKVALELNYTGAAHLDDLSYVLRLNSVLQDSTLNTSDESVKDWMTNIVKNFVSCSTPTCGPRGDSSWWPAAARPLRYQHIAGAAYAVSSLTEDQQSMTQLFDSFYQV